MPAMHQTGVREIVLHFAGAIRCPRVEQLLDTLPSLAAYEGFVRTLVGRAVPIEIATVKTLSKYMVDIAAIQLATAQRYTLAVQFFDERSDGMTSRHEALEELRDHRRRIGIWYDRALAARTVRVLVADWSAARVDSSLRFFSHSLTGLLAQIEAVVARHQDLDAMNELFGRARIAADDFVFFDEMDHDAEFIYSCVVLYVSVEAIRLLDQDRAAFRLMLSQKAEHLTEVGSAALLSCFHIGELLCYHKTFAVGVLA